jgi:type IV pilus assembly protein PilV
MAKERGFTLIEILVTILILVLGLLGVIGMQARASGVEFESYQRGQALSLARDMQARLLSSRGIVSAVRDPAVSSTDGSLYFGSSGAANYVDAFGNCVAPPAGDLLAAAKYQACIWGRDLQGVAEKEGGNAVGAMVGARGCIIRMEPPQLNALADLYIVVVWQGVGKRAEPLAGSAAAECASNVAFGTGLRRGVSIRVLVPDLKK